MMALLERQGAEYAIKVPFNPWVGLKTRVQATRTWTRVDDVVSCAEHAVEVARWGRRFRVVVYRRRVRHQTAKNFRNQARQDWQQHASNRREDWQEFADDHSDDHVGYYGGGYYHGGYAGAAAAGAAIGAAAAAAYPPAGRSAARRRSLPSARRPTTSEAPPGTRAPTAAVRWPTS